MKVLVLFLLAVLGWSLAEGTHMQKCDLMTHLQNAVRDPQMKAKLDVPSVDDLVAKIVCKSEVATGFDTGAVKELKPGQEPSQGQSGHKARGQRSPMNPPPQNPPPQNPLSQNPPPQNPPPQNPPPQNPPPQNPLPQNPPPQNPPPQNPPPQNPPPQNPPPQNPPPQNPPPQNPPSRQHCTLHGIFQLASHLVCDDGVTPSANMCGTSCSNLQDSNIWDDIACLLNVTISLSDSFFGVKTWEEAGGQMKHVMEEKCADVQASTYFKTCPRP